MALWYASDAELETAADRIAALPAATRRVLEETIMETERRVTKISAGARRLEDEGFLFIRDLNGFDTSATLHASLWGEEALDAWEQRQNKGPAAMPMHSTDIMRALGATTKRLEKEAILRRAWDSGNREFFSAMWMAYDPHTTFGIKQVPTATEGLVRRYTFTYQHFLALADQLSTRQLTGNAAGAAVGSAMLTCRPDEWNLFYRPILRKDVKAGIQEKTINKVLTEIGGDALGYRVPVFGLQLAEDGADAKHSKFIAGRKLVDLKYDGVRLLSELDKEAGTVTQFTREGRINTNFPDIRRALERAMPRMRRGFMLDGEITSTDFQTLMTGLNRKYEAGGRLHPITNPAQRPPAVLWLFDILPLDDYRASGCNIAAWQRHDALLRLDPILRQASNGLVCVLPKLDLDLSTSAGQAAYAEFQETVKRMAETDRKVEGFMVKDPYAAYEFKRNRNWLKRKPWIELTMQIKGFEIGKPDSRHRDTLGALLCEGEYGGQRVRSRVSGMTDAWRHEFWNNQIKYQGFMVEVRADALTLAQGATIHSLRFPRVKGLRGTKAGQVI